ncbi:cytochrome P450 [Serendipita vermifera]|nr:cytochrome P450 [Serendipita vermifera]
MPAQLTDLNGIISTITSSPAKPWTATLIATAIGYLVVKRLQHILSARIHGHPYPPGPPREFLIGALRSFPKSQYLERFCEWATTYGDIVYAPVPGNDIVILNSYDVAHEFLSKRPSSTSGRQFGILGTDFIGWAWTLGVLQPGPNHSTQRKMLRRAIGPQRVSSHDAMVESTVAKLMTGLKAFRGNPNEIIQKYLGEMISRAAYGGVIWNEMGDNLADWNLRVLPILLESIFYFWLVNVFTFLRFIPDWVPGLRFKQLIREGKVLSKRVRFSAFERGVGLYNSGRLGHSILGDLFEEFGETDDVRDAVATLYTAASDTTTAGAIQFLHSLFLFPEVSKRVFEKIQSITQGQRLPKISDRSKLPFTEAVWKEAARWRPYFPIGLPHVSSQDEVIRGSLVPKGAIIHTNHKMMLHDHRMWGDPEVFRPERFLESGAAQLPNPITVQFGWGTRQCPGIYLADRVIFHLVTTVISLYNVDPLEGSSIPDPNGIEYTAMGIQQPIGFECRFTVRDEKAQNLLRTISLGE